MIGEIPKYIKHKIIKDLPLRDILNICQINKHFRDKIYNDNFFWESKFSDSKDGLYAIETKPDNMSLIKWYSILFEHSMFNAVPNTRLVFGVENNNLKMVEDAINNNKNFNMECGRLVNCAVENNNFNMVKILIDNESAIRTNALEIAVQKDNMDIMTYLLEHGAKIGKALEVAIKKNNYLMVDYLIEKSSDMDYYTLEAIEICNSVGNYNMADYLYDDSGDSDEISDIVLE